MHVHRSLGSFSVEPRYLSYISAAASIPRLSHPDPPTAIYRLLQYQGTRLEAHFKCNTRKLALCPLGVTAGPTCWLSHSHIHTHATERPAFR
jgi:hypothetical protein